MGVFFWNICLEGQLLLLYEMPPCRRGTVNTYPLTSSISRGFPLQSRFLGLKSIFSFLNASAATWVERRGCCCFFPGKMQTIVAKGKKGFVGYGRGGESHSSGEMKQEEGERLWEMVGEEKGRWRQRPCALLCL